MRQSFRSHQALVAAALALAAPADGAIASFTASRTSFLPGQEVVLSWNVTPGDVIAIAPDVGPVAGATGSVSVLPDADTTYTLTDSTTGATAAVTVTMVKAGVLRNRWSFNEATGATVIDSVGGRHGTVIPSTFGTSYSRTGTAVALPGGSSETKAYIDLPNDLLGGLDEVTIEGWMTPIQPYRSRTWQRAFDFGTNTAGEVGAPGGSFSGTAYLFLALQNGTNTTVKVPGIRYNDSEQNLSVADAIGYGTAFHFAYVYDSDGNSGSPQVRYYKNGDLMATLNTPHLLASITGHNNWLGRSNWSADSNTQASYDEFRIWDRALAAQRVADNSAAGPDALPATAAIESFTAFPSTTIESGRPVRLSYVIANPSGGAFTAAIDQGVGGVAGTEGYATATPAATTTYTLAVTAAGVTRTATVTITVQPGSAPVAEELAVRVPYQTAVPVTLVANDYQVAELGYAVLAGPAHGTLSGGAPDLTYTPAAGFSGVDTFTWQADDGVMQSNPANVVLTVLPAPAPPVAVTLSEPVLFSDAVPGSFVGRLRTTDPNPDDSFVYQLVAGDGATHNDWFTIADGQLLAAHAFAADAGTTVSIRVRSTDAAGLAVEQVLPIPVAERPLTVVINELNYNPADNTQATEYVELHNPGPEPADVADWRLDGAVDYRFPAGTVIPPGGFLVVAENPAVTASWHGIDALGPWSGNLSSNGERVELRDAAGTLVDSASYATSAPWPATPNGDGPALELVNPLLDNNLGGNWRASTAGFAPATLLPAGAPGWKYFKGTTEPSSPLAAWRGESFDDAAWLAGQAPLGIFKVNGDNASAYNAETGVTLATQLTDMATYSGGFAVAYHCVYLRKSFEVTGPVPRALTVRVMHNDAAVVYVNGSEIARFGFPPGAPADVPCHFTGIYERGNDPWSEFTWLDPGAILHPGTNTLAIQAFAKPPALRSSQEDWGAYNVFDLCVDAELRTPADPLGTPGAPNSTLLADAPPPVHEVRHAPQAPRPWEPLTVTARVSDAQGLEAVRLAYQLCAPGNYIPATLPRSVAQVLAAPDEPPPPNPAFEDPANWTLVDMTDAGGLHDTAGDGVFTAVIPAQPHRTLIRYRILATDRSGHTATVPAPDDPRRNFAAYSYHRVPTWAGGGTVFGPAALESLPVYQWITRTQDFDALLALSPADQFPNTSALAVLAARRNENFTGTLVAGDQVIDHVAARLRGGNSRYMGAGKRHFRFNFPKGTWLTARDERGNVLPGRWESLLFNRLFGNKGGYDFGLPYEVAAKLWSLQGVPMPEAVFVHFRVVRDADEDSAARGDFWGLYQALELPEGNNFLEARGLPAGNFYKMSDWVQNGEAARRYQAKGAPAFGEDFDNIRYNIHQTTPQSEIERYVNMPLWYRYNAVQEAIRHYDVFTEPTGRHRVKNLLWYFRPAPGTNGLGQVWYMPYDWDASFGPNWNNGWCNTHNAIHDHDPIADSPTWALPKPARDPMKIEHRNHIREFRDLVWYRDPASGRGPVDDIIDDAFAAIEPFYQADMARWPDNTGAAGHYAGGAPAKVQDMKNFAFTGWTDPFGWDPAVGAGGRAAFLDSISDGIDANMLPRTPTISYAGAGGYPVDGLAFTSTPFSDPQGAGTFGAMQWRIGEVTDPLAPAYDPLADRIYEVTPVWESGELATFGAGIAIPGSALRSGHTYRARVRHRDATGRWGHWSAPLEFTATEPDHLAVLRENLMVTEIMYNPPGPAPAGGSEQDFEFLELQNVSDTLTLDLTDVRFTKGVDFDFSGSAVTSLAPGARVVVVKNLAAFQSRYGPNLPVAGAWDAADNLGNGGEQLRLAFGAGAAIHDFAYDDASPWPETPDGGGPSLVLIDPPSRPDHALAENWRASPLLHGSPGSDDTPFGVWLAAQGLTDPLADPDGDGINHWLLFALGGDLLPRATDALPVASLATVGATTHLVLTYQRRAGHTGVEITAEVSTDLVEWQSGPGLIEEAAPPVPRPDGTETVTLRVIAPVGTLPACFARLRVEAAEF